ncbi:hypothetical protein JXO52_16020 [bacterium]|nr:hypothetical protein [bacterium]
MNTRFETCLQSLEIPVKDIDRDKHIILRAMGYTDHSRVKIPDMLLYTVEKLLEESENHIEITACFRIFDPCDVTIDKTRIHVKGRMLQSGHIINAQLQKAETLVLFACTLGLTFDRWIDRIKRSEDMFETYVADIIGSELIESALDTLQTVLERIAAPPGYGYSNRFSPGYCGWPLPDQHILFALLAGAECGISLDENAFMTPVKSVSGIYGLGKSVKKAAYQCAVCESSRCYKKNSPITPFPGDAELK